MSDLGVTQHFSIKARKKRCVSHDGIGDKATRSADMEEKVVVPILYSAIQKIRKGERLKTVLYFSKDV